MRRTGPSAKTRRLVFERASYRCERCGRGDGRFAIHHRRPRGMGGTRRPETNAPDALLLLCEPCHLHVEAHREESLRLGYLVRQGQDPADVPVIRACSPFREPCVEMSACADCPRRAA